MKLKGSLILEASYVFPLTIIMIFLMLILAYYKHDKLVLQSGMKRYLIRSLSENKDYDFKEEALPIYYLDYNLLKLEKKKGRGRMEAEVSFELFPEPLMKGEREGNKMKEEYQAYLPQDKIRKLSQVLE